ncbi:hypothetical protein PoB_001712500 [Plakobranchus ocellatus]|uniref:MATH domain-containing protein n=1 Tax=Plakobranchus ocellatus TaxID=259542 RepID=A0AAV3Z5A1_9GAST|nr:hypothetical protein PoB_001712500 [Plakobranchus ocellatus]
MNPLKLLSKVYHNVIESNQIQIDVEGEMGWPNQWNGERNCPLEGCPEWRLKLRVSTPGRGSFISGYNYITIQSDTNQMGDREQIFLQDPSSRWYRLRVNI